MAKILTVDERLDLVDYDFVGYIPTALALLFVGFIKEVNDGEEENETPVLHLVMMDSVFNKERRCAILIYRGAGKTTIFAEYLILFIAAFGYFPGFGNVNLMLYITDSIENGVKNLRRNVEFRYENSEFLQKLIPHKKIGVGINGAGYVDINDFEEASSAQIAKFGGHKFTDIRLEFQNIKGDILVVKGYGARTGVRGPLSLDELVYTDNGTKTIREISVGDFIYTSSGTASEVTGKSDIFNDPMYELCFADGRKLKVNHSHLNPLYRIKESRIGGKRTRGYFKENITTLGIYNSKLKTGTQSKFFTKIPEPPEFSEKEFLLDPYLIGVALGDGWMPYSKGMRISGLKDDVEHYREKLSQYEIRSTYFTERSGADMLRLSIKGITEELRQLEVAEVTGSDKFIPECYMCGSIEQRRALLAGLLDTDGYCSIDGRTSFSNISEKLIEQTIELARGLGYYVSVSSMERNSTRKKLYSLYIRGSVNPFTLERKMNRWKKPDRFKGMIPLVSIKRIADEPSQCIRIEHESHEFITTGMMSTHNSKELGQRPTIAIFDDLFSDKDAESATIIADIENTVYKAVSKALHPTRQKMLWLGTPFNASDPLYKAVGSGKWNTSCYPICEHFDSLTTEEEFKGSWEDRFPYSYVKAEYEEAMALGRPSDFYQELMLRISSEEERLIPDSNLVWYNRDSIMDNLGAYNFYILTDLGASDDKKADFSVISVFAITSNRTIMLIDGWVGKVKFNIGLNKMFEIAHQYKQNLMGVGVEISAQQKTFISTIQDKQIRENSYFTLLSKKGKDDLGIAPTTNKFIRFKEIQPLFATHKIWIPNEMKNEPYMNEFLNELRGVSKTNANPKKLGTALHDDILDTFSMLGMIDIICPSEDQGLMVINEDGIYSSDVESDSDNDSYSC